MCGRKFILSLLVGFLWYGPLFGKMWLSLSGISNASIEAAKQRGMTTLYVLAFVGSLVMAFVLANLVVMLRPLVEYYFPIQLAFWLWLGFIAHITLGVVLWENKPWKLWFLNNGYQLVNLLVMSFILVLWR